METTPSDANPFAGMDPEMAANPQPMFKALRESMPGDARRGRRRRADRARRDRRGLPRPRDLLVEHVGGRPQEHPPADPAADRSARPQEVPQDPRPDLRPPADGAARGAGHAAGERPDRRASSTAARSTSPRSSRSRSRRRCSSRCSGCPLDELPALPHDEGRHHPARPGDRVRRTDSDAMHDLPAGDRRLDLRVLRRGARRARGRTARRPAEPVPRRRGRRARS